MSLKLRPNCTDPNCRMCGGTRTVSIKIGEEGANIVYHTQKIINNCGSYCVHCGEVLVKMNDGLIDIHECKVILTPKYCTICRERLNLTEECNKRIHSGCERNGVLPKCTICETDLVKIMEQMYSIHQDCLKCGECGETTDKLGELPCMTTYSDTHYHFSCMKCKICRKVGNKGDGERVCPLTLVHQSCV